MATIKNIIFDLGGVILNLDIQKTQNAFKAMGIVDFNNLFGLGHAASFVKEHETGGINDNEFIAALKKEVGVGYTDEDIIAAWNAMLLDFPQERIDFLNNLRLRYRLFLFSNTNGIHYTAFQKKYKDSFGMGGLDEHFEAAYYSHLTGLRKPSRESFEYILQQSGLLPAETLFIDDALVNTQGAQLAGLQTIHLLPGKTILDLGL